MKKEIKELIKELTKQTQPLKEKFIKETTEWAKRDFKKMSKLFGLSTLDIGEKLGYETEIHENSFGDKQRIFKAIDGINFYNHKASLSLDRKLNEIYSVERLGESGFIDKQVFKAKEHYIESILKLSNRILSKGLDENNLTLTTSYFDPNISTIITDGVKSVKAWTIIASGEIQKPHYRYLVK